MRRALLPLLLAVPLSSSAGIKLGNSGNGVRSPDVRELIKIGNSGNGLRPVAQREGLAVRWPVTAIRWQRHGLPGPAWRPATALGSPDGADLLELWLDGPVEITLPDGARLRVTLDDVVLSVPLDDPDATGAVGLDLELPAWLLDAASEAGELQIDAGHPWYDAALTALQDGALVRRAGRGRTPRRPVTTRVVAGLWAAELGLRVGLCASAIVPFRKICVTISRYSP